MVMVYLILSLGGLTEQLQVHLVPPETLILWDW